MDDAAKPPAVRGPSPDDLSLRLPAIPAALGHVRVGVGEFLEAREIGDETYYDALMVAHELAANAIAHGSREGDEIEVRANIRDDRLSIVVTDSARRGGVPFVLSPDEQRERGRGLQVVDQLAEWSEAVVGGRREVHAVLSL